MSENTPQLHSSIVALISLASGIAAKHPDMGLCQLDKLRHMGIPDSQIETVIEIARHIRDEAAQKLDAAFDEKSGSEVSLQETVTDTESSGQSCCSSTASGQSCC
jgi:hypothetical protein